MMPCYRGCLNVEPTGPVWSNRLLALNNLGKLHECVCVCVCAVHVCMRMFVLICVFVERRESCQTTLSLKYIIFPCVRILMYYEVVAPLYMFFSCMPHIPSSMHTQMFQILLRTFLHGISNLFSAQVFKQEHTPFLTNTHQVLSS
jgi:hypothetical protein